MSSDEMSKIERGLSKLKERVTMSGQIHKAYKVMLKLIDPRVVKEDKHIPLALMQKAKGIAFITVVKAGFIFSGSIGTGIVITRLPNGKWSGPSSIAITGAGWGAQVGVSSTDSVIILNTDAAVKAFSGKGQIKLGGNLSISVGPVGREGDVALTKGSMKGNVAACYSYSHSRGLFAGVSFDGAVLYARTKDNKRFYGVEKVHPGEILDGSIQPPFNRDLHLLYETLRLVLDIAAVEETTDDEINQDVDEPVTDEINVPESGTVEHEMQQIVSIPSLAGGNDDDLTTEECLWFIELRTIALESGLIQEGEFTNFEYAQYALIVNGNVSQGISRMTKVVDYMRKMQMYDDDIADAWQEVADQLFIPAGREKSGRPVLVLKASNLLPSDFKTKKQQRMLIKTFLHLFQYAITDLTEFRQGITLIIDLKGAKKQNVPPSEMRRLLKGVLKLAVDSYPVILQRVILYNVKNQKSAASAVNTMGKLFIPRTIRKRIEFRKLPDLLKIMEMDQIPKELGGEHSEQITEWRTRKEEHYNETCERMNRFVE
mmetsp:Transcript_6536/g.7469  ORF Transcript_6536/g.7469 Transcript_6536/m.7469 type:complete len:543 (+) Transcript_6536:155-1783(+)